MREYFGIAIADIFPDYRNGRVLAMRVVLYALALAITVLIVPGTDIGEIGGSAALAFFVLGVVFGLLNSFAKPLIQVVTLPFLFATFGLVVLLVNVLVLWLLELFASDWIRFSGDGWIFLSAAVIGVVGITLENLFGTTRPIFDPSPVEAEVEA